MALLGDIGGRDGAQPGHGVVVHGGQAAAHLQAAGHVLAQRAGGPRGDLLQDAPGRAGRAVGVGVGAVDDEVAHADALDAAGLEVGDPGLQGRLEAGQVALGGEPAVAQPQGGVLDRVLRLALDDPGVQVVGHPGGHVPAPVPAAAVLPIAEHDGGGARAQVLAQARDEAGQDGAAGVAVLHEGQARLAHGRGREDEGRVGDDQVEAAAGDGLQEGAGQELQAIGADGGQGGVEGGEGQGALGDVGGGHAVGVAQQVEGLDAAAAAQVEGGGDGAAGGQGGQGQAGAADAQDVVGGQGGAGGELAEVGGDPPADVAGLVAGLVGAQVDQGAHAGGGGGPVPGPGP